MKKIIGLLIFGMFYIQAFAVTSHPAKNSHAKVEKTEKISMEEFMTMTPKEYKEKTGKKLGFFNALKMKIVQGLLKKMAKKAEKKKDKMKEGKRSYRGDMPLALYIVLAIFTLGFIGIGVNTGWTGMDWVIGLILFAAVFLPIFTGQFFFLLVCLAAIIWAFYKMGEYY